MPVHSHRQTSRFSSLTVSLWNRVCQDQKLCQGPTTLETEHKNLRTGFDRNLQNSVRSILASHMPSAIASQMTLCITHLSFSTAVLSFVELSMTCEPNLAFVLDEETRPISLTPCLSTLSSMRWSQAIWFSTVLRTTLRSTYRSMISSISRFTLVVQGRLVAVPQTTRFPTTIISSLTQQATMGFNIITSRWKHGWTAYARLGVLNTVGKLPDTQ